MRLAPRVFYVSGAGVSLSQQIIAGNWQEAGDPLFMDVTTPYNPATPTLPDFRLKTNSPCIDAGVFLTTITSPGGTGRTFQVADANFFMDGWKMINGDIIQLQGSSQRVMVTNVNYSTRTLTVDSTLTWTQNQGISLPYYGSKPDMGAFEFNAGMIDTNLPPVVNAGPNRSIGFPTNTIALSGYATDPNGDALTLTWSQVSGPAAASFSSLTTSNTVASVSVRGAYLFRLTAFDGKASSAADVTITFLPDPNAIAFEAEGGTISFPFEAQGTYIVQNSNTSVTNGGRAAYVFTVPTANDYLVTGTVNAPDDGANSCYVNVDGEPIDPTMIWDVPMTSGFEARTATWRGDGGITPKRFTLAAGSHTFIIRGREAGLQFDRFEITKAAGTNRPPAPTNFRIVSGP
jgi:hypothetical protein